MKTLIATITLALATAGSAFALDANQLGPGFSLQNDYVADMQVAEFTSIPAASYEYQIDVDKAGLPATLR